MKKRLEKPKRSKKGAVENARISARCSQVKFAALEISIRSSMRIDSQGSQSYAVGEFFKVVKKLLCSKPLLIFVQNLRQVYL
jgi:hypothetical protein